MTGKLQGLGKTYKQKCLVVKMFGSKSDLRNPWVKVCHFTGENIEAKND